MTHTIVLDTATEEMAQDQARRTGVSTEDYLTAQITRVIIQQEQAMPPPEAQTLEVLLAQFQAEDPRAVPDPAREGYRRNSLDAALTDKYRRQGLNLS